MDIPCPFGQFYICRLFCSWVLLGLHPIKPTASLRVATFESEDLSPERDLKREAVTGG
jgi:hypothetical protein